MSSVKVLPASPTTQIGMTSEKYETTQLITNTPSSDRPLVFSGDSLNFKSSSGWPEGGYGFPMTDTGCPAVVEGSTWQTGSRYQHTNDNGVNEWSPILHFQQGSYGARYMEQHFCMKTEIPGTYDWPAGSYCVFRYGFYCPNGMPNGHIEWDDEDLANQNSKNGTVPAGTYNRHTRIYFCCMTVGDVSQPITLPTQNPFYLFPYNSEQCQAVTGMTATQEYFAWSQENSAGLPSQGSHPYTILDGGMLKISYCYYSE
ncbi:uncharacterized protein [Asterias amurensis]|uniref:uncharacterized protein n=1 Tax=Asterias amurensis TaxID=7602 RepID=UPI003AB89EE7